MTLSWHSQINQHIVEPSGIRGLPNGQFPASALYDVHDANGRVIGRLCKVAANAWSAMVAAAHRDGVSLTSSGPQDCYRDLHTQQSIFTDRYRTTNQGNGSRVCGGRTWYLRKGKATAACPGTSNHGRGIAVDVANASGVRLAWLEAHAHEFGWQWEVSGEPWHIHYMPGDNTPAAVQEYRGSLTRTIHQPEDDDMKIIVPDLDPDPNKNSNYLVGNGKAVRIETPRQLAELTKIYGDPVHVSDVTWDVIRSTGQDTPGPAKG